MGFFDPGGRRGFRRNFLPPGGFRLQNSCAFDINLLQIAILSLGARNNMLITSPGITRKCDPLRDSSFGGYVGNISWMRVVIWEQRTENLIHVLFFQNLKAEATLSGAVVTVQWIHSELREHLSSVILQWLHREKLNKAGYIVIWWSVSGTLKWPRKTCTRLEKHPKCFAGQAYYAWVLPISRQEVKKSRNIAFLTK